MLRVRLKKSLIGNVPRNIATVKALGLGKIDSVVEHRDTPQIRGMIHKVKHLLEVQEIPDEPAPAKKKPAAKAEETE